MRGHKTWVGAGKGAEGARAGQNCKVQCTRKCPPSVRPSVRPSGAPEDIRTYGRAGALRAFVYCRLVVRRVLCVSVKCTGLARGGLGLCLCRTQRPRGAAPAPGAGAHSKQAVAAPQHPAPRTQPQPSALPPRTAQTHSSRASLDDFRPAPARARAPTRFEFLEPRRAAPRAPPRFPSRTEGPIRQAPRFAAPIDSQLSDAPPGSSRGGRWELTPAAAREQLLSGLGASLARVDAPEPCRASTRGRGGSEMRSARC